ncbi:unnamed protein product [Rhizophagus irregularis]|nr:unnamed protein product [Rhizophagus irregularis]
MLMLVILVCGQQIFFDFFLFLGCFSFVASESSFFVGQTFWSSLSFFVGILTFDCLTPNEPELTLLSEQVFLTSL